MRSKKCFQGGFLNHAQRGECWKGEWTWKSLMTFSRLVLSEFSPKRICKWWCGRIRCHYQMHEKSSLWKWKYSNIWRAFQVFAAVPTQTQIIRDCFSDEEGLIITEFDRHFYSRKLIFMTVKKFFWFETLIKNLNKLFDFNYHSEAT